MQQHDDENEKLGIDLNRMLRALPRERQPDPALEDTIARQLGSRRLLVPAGRRGRARRNRGHVAVTWPIAAAAAVVLFVSGVIVGSSAVRISVPGNSAASVPSVAQTNAVPPAAGDLLLVADKRTSVTKAIKF